MAPTAARSRVGTRLIASAGKPACSRPSLIASAMASEVRKLSEPARRMAALPALRQSAPASAVTLGRLSKITPMTPSGVATRSIFRPFGRSNRASTRPTGSGSSAMLSTASAMASRRSEFRTRRSMNAPLCPLSRASARSSALAARIARSCARMQMAMARRAAFFSSALASATRCAAMRARRPRSAISVLTSPPSITFRASILRLLP